MADIKLADHQKKELFQKGVLGEITVTEQRRSFFDPRDGTWTKPLPVCDGRLAQYLSKGFLLSPPPGYQKPCENPPEPPMNTETPVEINQPLQYQPDLEQLAEIENLPDKPASKNGVSTPSTLASDSGITISPEMFALFKQFIEFIKTQQKNPVPPAESVIENAYVCTECGFKAKNQAGLLIHRRKAHHPKRKYTKRR